MISKGVPRSCAVGDSLSPFGSREEGGAFDSELDRFIKRASATCSVSASYEQMFNRHSPFVTSQSTPLENSAFVQVLRCRQESRGLGRRDPNHWNDENMFEDLV